MGQLVQVQVLLPAPTALQTDFVCKAVFIFKECNMKELNYQFRRELAQVHKKGRRDFSKKASSNQVEINGEWTVVIPKDCDAVIKNAALDFQDYFLNSMDICIR